MAVIDAQEARLLGLPEDTRIVSVEKLRERVPPQDREESDAKQKRLTEHKRRMSTSFACVCPTATSAGSMLTPTSGRTAFSESTSTLQSAGMRRSR